MFKFKGFFGVVMMCVIGGDVMCDVVRAKYGTYGDGGGRWW